MKIKDARKEYTYIHNKLLKEAKRGGLTSQEEKIFKLVEQAPSGMKDADILLNTKKAKAEFKRIRQTKKYKVERKYRNTFYKVLNRFKESELRREARRRLMDLPPAPDQLRASYFDIMQYQKIIKEGITRRQGGRVVRIKGLEGVKVQIKSLMYASDSERKKKLYIDTYIENMQNMGIPEEYTTISSKTGKPITVNLIKEMRSYLEKLSPNMITYLLDSGKLYDIKFYYVLDESDIEDLFNMLEFLDSNMETIEAEYNETISKENDMMRLLRQERRYKKKANIKINKNY